MNNLRASYERILEILRKISKETLQPYQRRRPKMSDLEVISLSLTAEYMGFDSENHLFRNLPKFFTDKIERSVYNRRRRKLSFFTNQIRIKLAQTFNEFEDCFIVDSMPLEICRLSRSKRSRICKEQSFSLPNTGYCASQRMHYYGYKLHAICSVNGIFQSFDLSAASVHDIHYLKDMQSQISGCSLIGDKGYLSSEVQLNLFENAKIKLDTPKRKNQKDYKPQFYLFKKKE